MSLHPKDLSTIPEETARIARTAFSKGNPYLTLRDELGPERFEDHVGEGRAMDVTELIRYTRAALAAALADTNTT